MRRVFLVLLILRAAAGSVPTAANRATAATTARLGRVRIVPPNVVEGRSG
ncbi:hypothetical protein [Streptomyces sp. NPDC003015]